MRKLATFARETKHNHKTMDINSIKAFIEIASGRSMTTVAESTGVTKSAVSHMIRAIEKELGADLFIRSAKTMQLSECGSSFLNTARRVVADYDEGVEQLQMLTGEVTGDLRIGVGSFVEPVIRKAVAKIAKDNPNLRITAYVYRASTLHRMLCDGAIDAAFTLNKAYDGEGIISVPCIPIRIMAVMSKTHPLAKHDIITFDELCQYDCIMPSEDRRAFATINRYLDRDLTKIRNRVSVNTADGALNMVSEERFITFSTAHHIINRPNLVAIPIEGLEQILMSNMHYLENHHLKRSAITLLNAITDYAIPFFNML